MVLPQEFAALRLELSVKAKNGLDFIAAASLVWLAITFIWTLPYPPKQLGSLTFLVGALLLPLAWLFSKVLGTTWTLPHNPLQPLGLWLNFAQLFYFPLLFFVFGRQPAYFIMAYGIITGAHFFPYAWFYDALPFALMAGVISVGCLLLGVRTATTVPYAVPAFVAGAMLVLGVALYGSYRRRVRAYGLAPAPAR